MARKCNCWKGCRRVPGTKPCAKGSCVCGKSRKRKSRMKSKFRPHYMYHKVSGRSKKANTYSDHVKLGKMGYIHKRPMKYKYKMRGSRKRPMKYKYKMSRKRKSRKYRAKSKRKCRPTGKYRSAKMVDGKCIKFGYKPMPIKKHKKGRKKSFCARHRCKSKTKRASAGYQSCKAWGCKTR